MNASPEFSCLVLEDDPDCAAIIQCVLVQEGGETVVTGTLAAARSALAHRDFDLYILDYRLPDGTGSDFFYELRRQGRLATAIMLTGMPELSLAVELTRNGLFNYLIKPFNTPQFVACLRQAKKYFKSFETDLAHLGYMGCSHAMRGVRQLVRQAAQNPSATVLLTGETGVGKDWVARLIHQLTFGEREPVPPLICLNCATLPGDMFEAELFGAEKGAYTGAYVSRRGLAEAANDGTLFLNEIAEVPLPLQAKLLQFLDARSFRRLGSTEVHQFTGRLITATNRSLAVEVAQGRFRADLWYRLDVFAIHVPPLRERIEDLGGLIELLLDKLAGKYQRPRPLVRPENLDLLMQYEFPGNVRELRNLLERSLLQTPAEAHWLEMDPIWARRQLRRRSVGTAGSLTEFEAQEQALIKKTLREEKGVIRRAAVRLGLTHQTLLRRLEKWPELRPPAPAGTRVPPKEPTTST